MIRILLLVAILLPFGAKSAHEPTERELEMIEEINFARTKPHVYYKFINDYIIEKRLNGDDYRVAKALESEMKRMRPLKALAFSSEMYQDTYKYGDEMQEKGVVEHSDLPYAENISAGISSVRMTVVGLLIDLGIPSRGHRKNLLNPGFSKVACREVPGKVGNFKYVFIQTFR